MKPGHPLSHVKPGGADSHRAETGSTSVLQNVFEGLGVGTLTDRNRATPQHDNEPLFSRSLTLDPHLKTSDSTYNRSPSITPENMFAQRDIMSEDRLKRSLNTPFEVMASQRASVR
ncbi:unnamed protein product [Anisakis simplex]|uniref:Uncharacterized protein n=1 Tax=Anisakis simplex TaxID=6269 RepID=A0A3P6U9K8_ANISI|nr:unnamed protein product [Anisakis simplex]